MRAKNLITFILLISLLTSINKLSPYITGSVRNVSFDKSYFYSANYFYLGANADSIGHSKTNALCKAGTLLGTDGTYTVTFSSLAPAKSYINISGSVANATKADNPIYDSAITQLSVMGQLPILCISKAAGTETSDYFKGDNKNIYLLESASYGEKIKTNIVEINDGAGATCNKIEKICASSSQIFAAVVPNGTGKNFGDANSGIAILIQDSGKLIPIDAQTGDKGDAHNLAYKLDPAAGTLFSITQAAQFSGSCDIHWDSDLSRVFIGLQNVQRASTASLGGAISLLVGRFEKSDDNSGTNKLILESALSLNANLFTANSSAYITGFYSDNATNIITSIYKIKTMHTSTGYSYVILNADSFTTHEYKNFVYALPIVASSNTTSEIGKIAKKSTASTIVESETDMTKKTDDAAIVGAGQLPIQAEQAIESMFVVNDSVFVCLAQDRTAANNEAGIFHSQAIFDSTGKIRAWTPWQRVGATISPVYGAGFDVTSCNYWYLTGAAASKNTVNITQWGTSVEQAGLFGKGLVSILGEEFTQANAGVHQFFSFDEFTPSFLTNKFSMAVATGYQKVALIQTGGVNSSNVFTPTQDLYQKRENVFVFNDEALQNIGPICTCDVSRITENNMGWVFVGGFNGLAVLRQSGGEGWDGITGLSALSSSGFPGDGNWSFKEIKNNNTSFSQVRKILCQGNSKFLYFITPDKLYRFLMDQDKFKDESPSDLELEEINIPNNSYLLDFLIIYRSNGDSGYINILLATTTGLYVSDNILDSNLGTVTWSKILISGTSYVDFPIAHLDFTCNYNQGGSTTDGNLYILNSDFSTNLANIYRFDVKTGLITHITEDSGTYYFYQIGQMRNSIRNFGHILYHSCSKHLGNYEFVKKVPVGSSQSTMRNNDRNIYLDINSTNYNTGILNLNVNGTLVVPVDCGIRVNE